MSRKQKLIEKLYRSPTPRDFTWSELTTLMSLFGFEELPGSGSRRKFYDRSRPDLPYLSLHRPHPGNELKTYMVGQVKDYLTQHGYCQ